MHLTHRVKHILTAITLGVALCLTPLILSGCSFGQEFALNLEQATNGLPLNISTYNFDGQKIDTIKTSHAYIHTDDAMSKSDDNGNELSDVIDVDYGHNRTIHVGATMMAYTGLTNYVDIYNHQHVDVDTRNEDKSVPLVNRFYKDFNNDWGDGQKGTVVLIKSQSGEPIGAFYGNHVSIRQTDMKDATDFIIDGNRLFVYRCDYTTYPVSVLKSSSKNQQAPTSHQTNSHISVHNDNN